MLRLFFTFVVAIVALTGLFFILRNQKSTKAAWFDDLWMYRKTITIDYTKVSGGANLTNFPALISVTDTNLRDCAQSDGDDILFTTIGGNKLSHEIESYTSATGVLVAWVKIPTLSASSNTVIYMYYGNPGAANQSRKTDVWDSNYTSVYHLKDDPTAGAPQMLNSKNNIQEGTVGGTWTSGDLLAGQIGNALDFDKAQSDYASLIDNHNGNNITVSAWIKGDQLNSDWETIAQRSDTGSWYDWQLYARAVESARAGYRSVFRIDSNNDSAIDANEEIDSGSVLSTATWYYINATYDGTNLIYYLNNSATHTVACSSCTITDSNNPVWIGANSIWSEPFDGIIDEFRISTTARSAGWITTEYNNQYSPATFLSSGTQEASPGPVAYWKFDEGHDASAYNSGNGGTLTGSFGAGAAAPAWQTEDQCISGKCLFFDGVDDYVSVLDNSALNPTTAITVEAWFKTPAISSQSYPPLVKKADTTAGYTLELDHTNNTLAFWAYIAGAWRKSATYTISLNTYYHAVGVFNGSNLYLYVNGLPIGSPTAQAGSITASTQPLQIGHDPVNTTRYFKGYIDDVKLFSYARSAAQIKTDYNSRNSTKGSSANLGTSKDNNLGALANGLVGYWKMDETSWNGTASEVIDSSGNGNNGQSSPIGPWTGPTTSSGKFGNAGNFDGTNDYVSIPDSANWTLSSGVQRTFAAWVNLSTLPGDGDWDTIVGNVGNGYAFQFNGGDAGTIQINWWDDTDDHLSSNISVSTNTWYHVAVTVKLGVTNGSNWYFNGVSQGTFTAANVSINPTNLTISDNSYSEEFTGLIDEARVYNRALSPAEVSQLYNWAPGPYSYWKFEEGSGITINDSSGNSHSGAFGASVPSWVPGKVGKGLSFNGTSSYAQASSTSLVPAGAKTVSFWMKTTSTSATALIDYTNGPSQKPNIGIWINLYSANKISFQAYNTSYVSLFQFSSNKTINDGIWHYVTGTWNGTTGTANAKLYIDGALDNTANVSTSGTDTPTSIPAIGSIQDTYGYFYNGQLDDIRIYNYARTQKQIVEDMNAGHPAPGSPVGSALGYWKFDEGADNTCSGGSNDVCNSGSQGLTLDGTSNATRSNSGKFGKALNFNGTDDYVSVADNAALDITGNITISGWVYINAYPAGLTKLIGKWNETGNQRSYTLGVSSSGEAYVFFDSDGTGVTALCSTNSPGGGIPLSTWTHVVGLYNGSNCQVVIDAKKTYTSSAYSSGVFSGSGNLIIGGSGGEPFGGQNRYLNAIIDEVKIYNFALTADEIKLEYNRGQGIQFGALSDNSTYEKQAANQEYCIPGDATSCAAPVGEWKLDENTGTSANDTSGNANLGTVTAGTGSWATGKYGSAYTFDGANTQINCQSGTTLDNLPASGMTLEAWIYPTSQGEGSAGIIMAKNVGTTPSAGWLLKFAGTYALTFTVDGSTDLVRTTSNSVVTANVWNHVAISWNGVITTAASVYIYVNGIEVSYATTTNGAARVDDGTSNFYIGNDSTQAGTFTGKIDYAKAFNYARTPAQIAWDYNRGAPIAHYKFDENTGTAVNDSSGNSYTGTWTGSNTHWATGKYNTAGTSPAYTDYVTVNDSTNLRLQSTSFTLSAWVYLNAYTANTYESPLLSKRVLSTYNGWEWYVRGEYDGTNKRKACAFIQTGTVRCSNSIVPTGQWKFLTFRYTYVSAGNTNTMDFFVDGVPDGTITSVGYVTSSAGTALRMFATVDNAPEFSINGQMDDARIYNYALTSAQIKLVYNQNAAVRFAPVTGSP